MSQRAEPESTGFILSQVCRLSHARGHELLHKLDLHRGQHNILRALWAQDGLTHTELAQAAHVRPATITTTVQRMEKAGFVTRARDAKDQRVSRVYLTQSGREIRESVEQVWSQLDEERFAGFTSEERLLLRQLLLQVRENLIEATKRE